MFLVGLMQRLESMRKFAFGLVNVFGVPEKKSFAVSGVWLGRGGGNFFEVLILFTSFQKNYFTTLYTTRTISADVCG